MHDSELVADLFMFSHVLFAAFVFGGLVMAVAGLWLSWSWTTSSWFVAPHSGAVIFLVVRLFVGVPCPFSVLEDWYRPVGESRCWLAPEVHKLARWVAFRNMSVEDFNPRLLCFAAVVAAVHFGNRRRSSRVNTNGPPPQTGQRLSRTDDEAGTGS
jgi:hypothetical protein